MPNSSYNLSDAFYTGVYIRLIDGEYKIIKDFAPKKESVLLTGVGLKFGFEKETLKNLYLDGGVNVESLFGRKLEDSNEFGGGFSVSCKYYFEKNVLFFIGTKTIFYDGYKLEDQHDRKSIESGISIDFGLEIRF